MLAVSDSQLAASGSSAPSTRIAVRLPGGKRVIRTFAADAPLAMAYAWIDKELLDQEPAAASRSPSIAASALAGATVAGTTAHTPPSPDADLDVVMVADTAADMSEDLRRVVWGPPGAVDEVDCKPNQTKPNQRIWLTLRAPPQYVLTAAVAKSVSLDRTNAASITFQDAHLCPSAAVRLKMLS